MDNDASKYDPATKEVVRYQEALWHGIDARISDGQNGVLYTPPDGEFIIREKLESLEQFLEQNSGFLRQCALFESLHYSK
jgi:hypothetical protein